MITTARKIWEIRRREEAGQSRLRISAALVALRAKSAAGPDGVFAALLTCWGVAAVATIGFLASH